MANNVAIKESKDFLPNIPSYIDDYGFTPTEYRIYMRIVRRAGEKGEFYESIPNLAKLCGVSDRTIQRILKLLVACNAVARQVRPGKPDGFRLNSFKKWKPSESLSEIRLVVTPPRRVSGVTGDTTETGVVTPQRRVVVTPETDEGIPSEGVPTKAEESATTGVPESEPETPPPPRPLPKNQTSLSVAAALAGSGRHVSQAEAIYRDIFAEVELTDEQGEIFGEIENLNVEVWRKTCHIWKRNNHHAEHFGNLIDRYENELKRQTPVETQFQPNGTPPVIDCPLGCINGHIKIEGKGWTKCNHQPKKETAAI